MSTRAMIVGSGRSSSAHTLALARSSLALEQLSKVATKTIKDYCDNNTLVFIEPVEVPANHIEPKTIKPWYRKKERW